MKHIEHIGIAVKDLAVSIPLFEKLLNTKCYKTETVASEKVITAFFQTGESKIEDLVVGDLVLTVTDGDHIARAVRPIAASPSMRWPWPGIRSRAITRSCSSGARN